MDLVTVLLLLLLSILLILYLTRKEDKPNRRIPGPRPDPEHGNNKDIQKAGGVFSYILQLHRQYGEIVAFWLGQQQVVSIASANLFKDTRALFDKPRELLIPFLPLTTDKGFFFANGSKGKELRRRYDHAFGHGQVQQGTDLFNKIAIKLCEDLSGLCKERTHQLPLKETFNNLIVQTIFSFCFGGFFGDVEALKEFGKHYQSALEEIDRVLAEESMEEPTFDTENVKTHVDALVKYVQIAINKYRENINKPDKKVLVDIVLQSMPSDELACRDVLTYIVAGFHTTGLLLTWSLYFLAANKDVQNKVYKEVQDVLEGQSQNMDGTQVIKMVYLKQVLDETLRCSTIGSAAVRISDQDLDVGGYVIPAKTPIIQAIGACFMDENLWQDPSVFDPDRFSPENRAKLARYAFEPFGFAGKRKCPGFRFTYCEVAVFLAHLLLNFEFTYESDAEVSVHRNFGFIGSPAEEIKVTLKPRSH